MHTKYFYTAKYETKVLCTPNIFIQINMKLTIVHTNYFYTAKYETNVLCIPNIFILKYSVYWNKQIFTDRVRNDRVRNDSKPFNSTNYVVTVKGCHLQKQLK